MSRRNTLIAVASVTAVTVLIPFALVGYLGLKWARAFTREHETEVTKVTEKEASTDA